MPKISGHFIMSELEEEARDISNPLRGWYRIVYYTLGEDTDCRIEDFNRQRQEKLELAVINISSYKNGEITEEGLSKIKGILDNYRKHKVRVILRGVYDHEGKACEKEPFSFSVVLRHMEQLIQVVSAYSDVVFIYQGLLIGNWGEMHSSRFMQTNKLTLLQEAFRNNCDNEIYSAVRTPSKWRMIHSENEFGKEGCRDGLFDDAIFGSQSHLGTFGQNSRSEAGWQQPWCIEEELDFEAALGLQAPNGGEMVFPSDNNMPSPEEIIDRLQKMHITYLNKYYDLRILDYLKSQKYQGNNVWNDKTLYEYIEAHLGYRYVVKNVYADYKFLTHKNNKLYICIENTGFAGVYKKVSVFIEWSELGGTFNRECVLEDLRETNKESLIEIVYPASHIRGNVYIFMEIAETGEKIRFANKSDSLGRVLIGAFVTR